MPIGPSRCSITAEASRWFDRQKIRKIELDDRPQGLRRGAVLLIIRQCVQPVAILLLEVHKSGNRIIPALDPAAPIGRSADANDRRAIGMRGTIPRLTFRAGHGCFTDRWTGHRSTPYRYVTERHAAAASATNGWRRYTSPSLIMAHIVRAILLATPRQRVCVACAQAASATIRW